MVIPFNIIRAKRVLGPESCISLKASPKKTFRSLPQEDRTICMRTGKWAFRLGLPRKKTFRSLFRTTTRFQRLRHRHKIACNSFQSGDKALGNRRSRLFNSGCGSKNMSCWRRACEHLRNQAKVFRWHCMHGFQRKETRRHGSCFTVDGKMIEPTDTNPCFQ